MSKYVAYIKVDPYLRQWLLFHYGNPVVFPYGSAENATIRRFLTTLPPGQQPQMPEPGDVAVCIPDSKQKPVVSYNYLGKHAKHAVVECIRDTFKLQMWNELNMMYDKKYTIITAVRAWCENNGISIEYDTTIKMQWQRMRASHLENGVDLRMKQRKRDKNF